MEDYKPFGESDCTAYAQAITHYGKFKAVICLVVNQENKADFGMTVTDINDFEAAKAIIGIMKSVGTTLQEKIDLIQAEAEQKIFNRKKQ